MKNIRGEINHPLPIRPLNTEKELHDCLDCEGCICEETCKKYEDEYFNKKKSIKKEGE